MSRPYRWDSESPPLPDEGYEEQRVEVPKLVQSWSEEQRAEFAVQLLKSVSPSLFSRTYNRLAPLYEYRDFLVLLPYELTALVSRSWNRFASDTTVWKMLYFSRGWKVNEEMIAWYLHSPFSQDMVPQDNGKTRPSYSTSNGKRKMVDLDMPNVQEGTCDDYEMLQAPAHPDDTDYNLSQNHVRHLKRFPVVTPSFEACDDVLMLRPFDEHEHEHNNETAQSNLNPQTPNHGDPDDSSLPNILSSPTCTHTLLAQFSTGTSPIIFLWEYYDDTAFNAEKGVSTEHNTNPYQDSWSLVRK
ncbi:hypothetical protein BGZ94_010388 [Podila epigama]|nr:hypothetical protein BGZ94_010388 [Podila epigama]